MYAIKVLRRGETNAGELERRLSRTAKDMHFREVAGCIGWCSHEPSPLSQAISGKKLTGLEVSPGHLILNTKGGMGSSEVVFIFRTAPVVVFGQEDTHGVMAGYFLSYDKTVKPRDIEITQVRKEWGMLRSYPYKKDARV